MYKNTFILGCRVLSLLLLLLITAYSIYALYLTKEQSLAVNLLLISLLVLAFAAAAYAVLSAGKRLTAGLFYLLAFSLFLLWWSFYQPSNHRDWQPDVARLSYADINENRVTVHNVREFTYRSEFDYKPAYSDQTYDLNKLEGVDLISVYWMGSAIAHTMLSFHFANDRYLTFSIEIRREKDEQYSALKGFFRQYELIYIVADEKDVVGLRTNYRNNPPEDVYIYPVKSSVKKLRKLFLQYIHRLNELHDKPEFYNTLTDNCTTGIWLNARVNENAVPLSWKVFLSGYLPEYLYETGKLNDTMEFALLEKKSLVNETARSQPVGDNFSVLIRSQLPR